MEVNSKAEYCEKSDKRHSSLEPVYVPAVRFTSAGLHHSHGKLGREQNTQLAVIRIVPFLPPKGSKSAIAEDLGKSIQIL